MTESNDALSFVEQALRTLRDAPPPEGPPADLLNATAARLRSLESPSHAHPENRPPIVSPRFAPSRLARYGGLMAACAAGIAFLTWIGLINHSATCAFADVQEQVRKVRSVKYVETRLKDKQPDAQGTVVESNAHHPRRHLVLGRYLHRTEVLDADGQIESVNIFNAQTGKWLDLDPKAKRCQILANQVTLDSESGKRTETTIEASPKADIYTEIRKIPAEATTRLPAKTIGDKEVVGFVWEQKIEKTNGTDTWKRTYWVNPVTKLPVRVEISHRSTDERMGPSDWVLTDFVFDEDLDESLFSTEPPAGYTVETGTIIGIQRP